MRKIGELGQLSARFTRLRAIYVCERSSSAFSAARCALSAAFSTFAAIVRAVIAPKHNLRITIIAGTIFVAAIIAAHIVFAGEIDLSKLVPGYNANGTRPVIVVANGKLTNTGGVPALNFEITHPSYKLIGTLAAGASIELPVGDRVAVQYEWSENNKTERSSHQFVINEPPAKAGRKTSTGKPATETPVDAAAPAGIMATYDPSSHMLTVSAEKEVEVRVDGFLMRPVSRTDKDGAQYRYIDAHVLVLGQDIEQGTTVTLEVVFTKPQDFYSIPIYVREPGKPPVYFTVSVSTGAHS